MVCSGSWYNDWLGKNTLDMISPPRYCPEGGGPDPRMMWAIIGAMTLTSPVLLTVLERCVREPGGGESGGHQQQKPRRLVDVVDEDVVDEGDFSAAKPPARRFRNGGAPVRLSDWKGVGAAVGRGMDGSSESDEGVV